MPQTRALNHITLYTQAAYDDKPLLSPSVSQQHSSIMYIVCATRWKHRSPISLASSQAVVAGALSSLVHYTTCFPIKMHLFFMAHVTATSEVSDSWATVGDDGRHGGWRPWKVCNKRVVDRF